MANPPKQNRITLAPGLAVANEGAEIFLLNNSKFSADFASVKVAEPILAFFHKGADETGKWNRSFSLSS